jgi:hypothetical protein
MSYKIFEKSSNDYFEISWKYTGNILDLSWISVIPVYFSDNLWISSGYFVDTNNSNNREGRRFLLL